MQQQEAPDVSGIVEAVSMEETLALMLELRPETQEITALVDGTDSGQGDLAVYYQQAGKFPGVKFSDISLAGLSFSELAAALRTIGPNRSILLLSAYLDRNGRTLTFYESLQLIRENLSQPIFHLWLHGIGEGILGGKVISHFEQGKAAAEMALRVLEGEDIDAIPIDLESPNIYVFDYHELERFGLSAASLPQGSLVINRPQGLYSEYKPLIWSAALLLIFLTLLVFVMAANINRRRKAEIKLIKARTFIENILNASTDTYYVFDPETEKPIRWNRALVEISGYGEEEIGNMNRRDFFPPEYHHLLKNRLESIQKNRSSSDEMPLLTKDGKKVFFEYKAFLVKNPTGDGAYAVSIGRDISERKKNEEALRKSEERFREFVEGTEDIITRVSASGKFIYISPAGARLCGLPVDEMIGRSAFEFIHPEDRKKTEEAFQKWLSEKAVNASFENRLLGSKGEAHNLLWSIKFHYDQEGELIGINSIARDITELRKTEEKLSWQVKVNAYLAGLGQSLIKAGSSEEIALLLLQAAYKTIGGELCLACRLEADSRDAVRQAYPEIDDGGSQDYFFQFMDMLEYQEVCGKAFYINDPSQYLSETADGGLKNILCAPVIIGDKLVGRLASVNSNRDYQAGDAELMERLALFFSLALQNQWAAEATERALEKAEAANRVKNEFLANITHELRTPLNPIIGMTDLVMESPELSDENRELLGSVGDAASRLLTMINDLILLSKLDALSFADNYQLFSLTSVVESVLTAVRCLAAPKNLTVKAEISPDIPGLLHGDSAMLKELLKKIGENAVKFTETGEISISFKTLKKDGDQILIECRVSDTGVGIQPDRLENLFNDFTQADGSATRNFGGLGLGLTLARRIVSLMGGAIRAESEVGRGSAFIMEIPFQTGE